MLITFAGDVRPRLAWRPWTPAARGLKSCGMVSELARERGVRSSESRSLADPRCDLRLSAVDLHPGQVYSNEVCQQRWRDAPHADSSIHLVSLTMLEEDRLSSSLSLKLSSDGSGLAAYASRAPALMHHMIIRDERGVGRCLLEVGMKGTSIIVRILLESRADARAEVGNVRVNVGVERSSGTQSTLCCQMLLHRTHRQ